MDRGVKSLAIASKLETIPFSNSTIGKFLGFVISFSAEEITFGFAKTSFVIAPEAPATPELTIQDLGNLRAIIDVASQRGAFRAAEMAAVGSAFNKLNDFLNAVAPQEKSNADESQQASA